MRTTSGHFLLRPASMACAAAALAAVLTACSAVPSRSAAADESMWPLEGTYWRLASVKSQPVAAAPSGREAYLMLDASQQRAAGFAGCNGFFGGYRLAGGTLRFDRPGATLMACPQMATEQLLLTALPAVASWRVDGDRLQLLDGQGLVLAQFQSGSIRMDCGAGQPSVLVHYDNSDAQRPRAQLAFDGRNYAMHSVISGSGARYATEQGRRADWSLAWHTKGREGVLIEAPLDHARAAADTRTVAQCTQR